VVQFAAAEYRLPGDARLRGRWPEAGLAQLWEASPRAGANAHDAVGPGDVVTRLVDRPHLSRRGVPRRRRRKSRTGSVRNVDH
jgi:hypothetical protein